MKTRRQFLKFMAKGVAVLGVSGMFPSMALGVLKKSETHRNHSAIPTVTYIGNGTEPKWLVENMSQETYFEPPQTDLAPGDVVQVNSWSPADVKNLTSWYKVNEKGVLVDMLDK